jgi:hypothetical protein
MLMKGASAIIWQHFGMADKKLIKSAGEQLSVDLGILQGSFGDYR